MQKQTRVGPLAALALGWWCRVPFFFRFMGKFIKKAYIRVLCVNRVILGYFGSFLVISGSIRVSIGGFVKRLISGYSRESCYLGHLRSFLVI